MNVLSMDGDGHDLWGQLLVIGVETSPHLCHRLTPQWIWKWIVVCWIVTAFEPCAGTTLKVIVVVAVKAPCTESFKVLAWLRTSALY